VFFHDPVRNEKIFFNVYGYQFDSELNFDGVQEVLNKRHILKQRGTAKGVKFAKGITEGDENGENKFPFVETTYAIQPMKDYPYIKAVKLRVFFVGKTMLVQETMTSNTLFNSTLIENFMRNVIFNPNNMHEAAQPATPSAAPDAPVDTTPEADLPSKPANYKPGEKPPEPEATPAPAPIPETKAAPSGSPATP
jgi:hypothetical protein